MARLVPTLACPRPLGPGRVSNRRHPQSDASALDPSGVSFRIYSTGGAIHGQPPQLARSPSKPADWPVGGHAYAGYLRGVGGVVPYRRGLPDRAARGGFQ